MPHDGTPRMISKSAGITLRPYQESTFDRILASTANYLVVEPTGAGKTAEMIAVSAALLGKVRKVLIATTQNHIQSAFVERSYDRISTSAQVLAVPYGFIRLPLQNQAVKGVNRYLALDGTQDHVLAVTHAVLTNDAIVLPDDMSDTLIQTDETHHAGAAGLKGFLQRASDRGARIIGWSASPYRLDNEPILLEGMEFHKRTLAEHMAEGYAPKNVHAGIIPLGKKGDKVTSKQFYGDDYSMPVNVTDLCQAMVGRWKELGRPKLIVRLPAQRGGSKELVHTVMKAFAKAADRGMAGIFDCTGESQKGAFLAMLQEEDKANARSYLDSKYEVLVGINRVVEGTNWAQCATVFSYGMPRSPTVLSQLLGRATRQKGNDHPHKDDVYFECFVDSAGGLDPLLDIDHSELILQLVCLLDHGESIRFPLVNAARRAAGKAEIDLGPEISPVLSVEQMQVQAKARCYYVELQESKPDATVKEYCEHLESRGIPTEVANTVVLEFLAGENAEAAAEFGDKLVSHAGSGVPMDTAQKMAIDAVLGAFRDATLQPSEFARGLASQVHTLTHLEMSRFAAAVYGERYQGDLLKRMHEVAAEQGGKCLATVYVNNNTKYPWECAKGHQWEATAGNVVNTGTWCPECAGKKLGNLGRLQEVALSKGGKCLATVYGNAHTRCPWECAKGHQWEATAGSVVCNGTWCPECGGSKLGNLGPLQDFALSKGGKCLATVYSGNKAKYPWECAKGHQWEASASNVIHGGKWCPECAGTKLGNLGRLHEIALSKGGKCLATVYGNARTKCPWECAKGHQWEATANDVVNKGTWCPECARAKGWETRRAKAATQKSTKP